MVSQVKKPLPRKTYTPFSSYVALHVHHHSETDGGIVLPDNAQTPNTPICTVIAVGPDVQQIKVGQKVLVGHNVMGTKVRHAGQETVVVEGKHILGVVDGE